MSRPHLFQFLDHSELKLALCIVFATKAEETQGAYSTDRYASPGEEGPTADWTELVLRTIRYLSFEHGMQFRGVTPHRDGRITAERPICPRNNLYVWMFKAGGFPDFDILLPQAVRYAQERVPSLNVEPLRSLAADIEAEIALRQKALGPSALAVMAEKIREERALALEAIAALEGETGLEN